MHAKRDVVTVEDVVTSKMPDVLIYVDENGKPLWTVTSGQTATPIATPISSSSSSSSVEVQVAVAVPTTSSTEAAYTSSSYSSFASTSYWTSASTTSYSASSATSSSSAVASSTSSSGSIIDTVIGDVLSALLSALSILEGSNADSNTADVWFGNDGDYITEFENDSDEDIVLIVWGPSGSWVNVDSPFITYQMSAGSSVNVSFASGVSGGWSAIYSDTTLSNGQVYNTWGEYTFDGEYSTFDVTRLVNMNGHDLSIVGSECTSDMETCVFTCDSGDSCEYDYTLENCDSQSGAEDGTYDGADSGGCLVGSDNYVKATFS